jgi:hypothetical protein
MKTYPSQLIISYIFFFNISFVCRPGRVKRKNAKKGTEKADEEEED